MYQIAEFQIHQNKALENIVVKNQINGEMPVIKTDPFLPGNKRESPSEFQ